MNGCTCRKWKRGCGLLAILVLCGAMAGCLGEDEQLQQQLIDARVSLEAAQKQLEEAKSRIVSLEQQKPASAPAAGQGADPAELQNARGRIADLEAKLARAEAASPSLPDAGDIDLLVEKLEEVLLKEVRGLVGVIENDAGIGMVEETSIKRIAYPEQVVRPFTSAITFAIQPEKGEKIDLMFPVSADVKGRWKLPTAAEVLLFYQRAAVGDVASSPTAPDAPGPGSGEETGAPSAPGRRPDPAPVRGGIRQTGDGVFVVDWGDSPAAPAGAGDRAQSAPEPVARRPQQPPAEANPPAPPAVPPPIMPVERDIIIKFE